MQKVVGINLNGNAYQVEEPGYEALRDVPTGCREPPAEQSRSRRDHGGPRAGDRREVRTLPRPEQDGGHRGEMATIIAEIGPVDSPGRHGGRLDLRRSRRDGHRREAGRTEAAVSDPSGRDDLGCLQLASPRSSHRCHDRARRIRASDLRHIRRRDSRLLHHGGRDPVRRHARGSGGSLWPALESAGAARSGQPASRERARPTRVAASLEVAAASLAAKLERALAASRGRQPAQLGPALGAHGTDAGCDGERRGADGPLRHVLPGSHCPYSPSSMRRCSLPGSWSSCRR